MTLTRTVVIGLDCLAPQLAFHDYADVMPNLSRLRAQGGWGRLRSVTPPITVPAWSCALASRDPGALGVYGFRNRGGWGYGDQPGDLTLATSHAIRVPRAFEHIADTGRRAICLSIPGTYPPPQRENLDLVSCFLAPEYNEKAVNSPAFWQLMQRAAPRYQIDVRDFRTDRKADIQAQCVQMMQDRFSTVCSLIDDANAGGRDPWALLMFVEIGTDRMHHAFWSVCQPDHPRYQPNTPWQHALRDYYQLADRGIGNIVSRLTPDDHVIVMSDHGARPLFGGVCVNEWLIREGYLVLKQPAEKPNTKLTPGVIDWSRTTAWGDGGYYARIFLNIAGREPNGVVPADGVESLRKEIARRAESLDLAELWREAATRRDPGLNHAVSPRGRTRALRSEDIYPHVNGYPPDLQIFWGDLDFRSIGTLGWGQLIIEENDTGPDEANHDWDGVYVGTGPRLPTGEIAGLSLLDIGPTLCDLANAKPLPDAQGRSLCINASST